MKLLYLRETWLDGQDLGEKAKSEGKSKKNYFEFGILKKFLE